MMTVDEAVYVKPRRQINPLIPICAAALVLFLIASVIVLALIPIYLPGRDADSINQSGAAAFRTSLALQNGSLPVGPLSDANCQSIQTVLRQQAQSSSAVNPSVPTVTSCTVSGNAATGKRKKRQTLGNQIDIVGFLSGGGRCLFGTCLIARLNAFLNLLLARGQFIISLILADGTQASFATISTSGSAIAGTGIGAATLTTTATTTTTSTNNLGIDFFGLNNQNQLSRLNTQNPSSATSTVTVTGLKGSERLLSIDFRPATGQLYGVTDGSQLYQIDQDTGVARPIGSGLNTTINGSIVSVDFNPTVDRLRLVSNVGQNIRINPETGAVIGIDGAITGGTIVAVAYNNNHAGVTNTTLFDIDSTKNQLFQQNPPNNGTLVAVGSSLGVDPDGAAGFDISPGGVALAAVVVNGVSNLYLVDLNTGLLSQLLGNLSQSFIALAIPTDPVAYTILTSNNTLVIFNPLNSNLAPVSKNLTGLVANDLIVGLDFRPLTGQLYALGSTSHLYTINTASGQATATGAGAAFTPPLNGTNFGFDFNPVVDRIRVDSDFDQNLRLNPDTGALAGQDTNLNSNSSNINQNSTTVTGAAYTNNVANATTTTLFVLDSGNNRLYIQNPPGNGTLVDVGPLGIDVDSQNGFDIGGKSGNAYALLTVNGVTSVYQINLSTGAASSVSSFPFQGRALAIGLGF